MKPTQAESQKEIFLSNRLVFKDDKKSLTEIDTKNLEHTITNVKNLVQISAVENYVIIIVKLNVKVCCHSFFFVPVLNIVFLF